MLPSKRRAVSRSWLSVRQAALQGSKVPRPQNISVQNMKDMASRETQPVAPDAPWAAHSPHREPDPGQLTGTARPWGQGNRWASASDGKKSIALSSWKTLSPRRLGNPHEPVYRGEDGVGRGALTAKLVRRKVSLCWNTQELFRFLINPAPFPFRGFCGGQGRAGGAIDEKNTNTVFKNAAGWGPCCFNLLGPDCPALVDRIPDRLV